MPQLTGHAPSATILDSMLYSLPDVLTVWHTSSQPPLTITYKFETHAPADINLAYSGWTPFTTAEEDAIRAILGEFADVLNVVFVEAKDAADPDINFGKVDLGHAGEGGFQYQAVVDGDGNLVSKSLDGFAVFDSSINLADPDQAGVILHEIGHALTLKHPGLYTGSADQGNSPPYLPKSQDNNQYTVMSYRPDPHTGEPAKHLMLYDIAALQARFGANDHYRSGDTTYSASPGETKTIWDTGGNDVIDGGHISNPVTIDLREGKFSSLEGKDDLAIAYGVIIERAIGGDAGDKLIGNQWNNKLAGKGGADLLIGGKGNDRLDGGNGGDTLKGGSGKDWLDGSNGQDRLIGGSGADKFVFDSPLTGVDRIVDFTPHQDVIVLDDAVFTALNGLTSLPGKAFWIGPAAHDHSDRIIYDTDTGNLFYDPDGDRQDAAVKFAKIGAHLDLHANDFLIV